MSDSFIEAYWIFSDITADSFHWENVRLPSDGERRLVCEIFGRRVGRGTQKNEIST